MKPRHCEPWHSNGLRHQCIGHDQTTSCRCGCGELRPTEQRQLCGSCDCGLPMSCICPEDPEVLRRLDMAIVVQRVEQAIARNLPARQVYGTINPH